MLYGRFAITMSYHKKVNAVAVLRFTQIKFHPPEHINAMNWL